MLGRRTGNVKTKNLSACLWPDATRLVLAGGSSRQHVPNLHFDDIVRAH
jgi:hypothetical protein